MHFLFFILELGFFFFHINKYNFFGQKRTKKTKTMIFGGIIMNVFGMCLNQ